MTRPAASVVVPLLGTEDAWLERSVLSAVQQTACEVVVVASRAAPSSNLRVLGGLARRFGNIQVVPLAADAVGAAVNAGIGQATATRVGVLMPDDWLEPDTIARTLDIAADIVGTGTAYYDTVGGRRYDELTRVPSATALAALPPAAMASALSPFLLFDARLLAAVGGADDSIGLGADDYDLTWRAIEHGATVGVVEAPLYNVRDGHGRRAAWLADLDRILAKHGAGAPERARLLASRDALVPA